MDIVYIETSIVSHATARPSTDPATAVLQDHAKRWMDEQAANYELVTSQVVLAEAARGDQDAAARRLTILANIPVLEENPDTDAVADALVSRSLIPASARLDAMHVAAAALAGVQYLLTQNCRHIANAHVLPRVYRLLDDLGAMLMTNPILKELHDIREQILAEHGEDLGAYVRAELERAKASGHPVAQIKQRTIRCTGAAKSGEMAVENHSSPPRDR